MEIARQLVAEIRANPGVAYTYTTDRRNRRAAHQRGQRSTCELKDRKLRPHYLQIKAEMRERLKRFRALRTAVVEADQLEAESRPVQLVLRGHDLARMAPLSQRLMREVQSVPGATDIDTSEEEPRPEVRVEIERKAAGDLGLDLGTVASTVRGLVAGEVVSQFEDPDGDSYDVRLRVDPSQRSNRADLLGLDLPGRGGGPLIPLEPGGAHRDRHRRLRRSGAAT